jgi:hypothetical protein
METEGGKRIMQIRYRDAERQIQRQGKRVSEAWKRQVGMENEN